MNLSKQLRQARKHIENNLFNGAIEIYQKILNKFPNNIEAINNLATINLINNNFEKANNLFKKSLEIDSKQIEILLNLSNYYLNSNNLTSAKEYVESAYNLQQNNWQTLFNLGRLKYQEKEYEKSIIYYHKSIKIHPNYHLTYTNIALCYEMLGHYDDALNNLNLSLQIKPKDSNTLLKITYLNMRFMKYEEALIQIREALDIEKSNLEICCTYIDCLILLKRFIEAKDEIEKYKNHYPNKIQILLREIDLNYMTQNFSKAEKLALKILSLENNNPEALSNLLTIYSFEKNQEKMNKLIKNYPFIIEGDYQKNKLIIALSNLKNYDFGNGWKNYYYRFYASGIANNRKYFSNIEKFKREISFNEVEKKTLIIKEQGLGDQILFSKFLTFIDNKNIDIQIDKRLIPIYKKNFPHLNFIDQVNNDNYEYMLGLGDLGYYFLKNKNDFNTFNNFKITHEAQYQIPFKVKNKLCGLSWKSNAQTGDAKSIKLEDFKKLFSNLEYTFVNLQYGDVDNEIKSFNKINNNKLENDNQIDKYNDMEGLFSLINSCDFIITTSNVTAHIAGILGKKTFLLSFNGRGKLWYWYHEKNGVSLWYPSLKIYQLDVNLSNIDKVYEKIIFDMKN